VDQSRYFFSLPGAPNLHDFYLDPSLEACVTSEDDDGDDGFGCQIRSTGGQNDKE